MSEKLKVGDEANWWSAAALDVIRHARMDEPNISWSDWQNAITNGLLSAYNRGKDAVVADPEKVRREEQLREALHDAIFECREHNSEYGHRTKPEVIAQWEALLATPAPVEAKVEHRWNGNSWECSCGWFYRESNIPYLAHKAWELHVEQSGKGKS